MFVCVCVCVCVYIIMLLGYGVHVVMHDLVLLLEDIGF